MENFVVSARKYRPQTFDDVVGQGSITRTLDNAIKNNHLAQAFLFCGPRGVGKTTCARILAKKINSEGDINQEEDFSFNIFELDAASNNSVDDIRNLIDQVRIPPQVGNYRVYIIDEVHMLSASAFNAFLKTLEEPPPHALFILATTEKHKILPTILSRCQIFDFKRIEIPGIIEQLESIAKTEKIKIEHDALHIIAQKADGAMRDALSIFDQIVSFCGSDITYKDVIENLNVLDYDYYFKISDAIADKNISNALITFDQVLEKGFDGHNFINGLAEHIRNLLVCKNPETLDLLLVGTNIKEKYKEQSQALSSDALMYGLRIISKCDIQYKTSKNQRLLVEIMLMQLCSILESLEKKKMS
ncbi:MAG: DNA polymerase III subunit gamma/tau [Salibacteraceae bacterium]